MNIIKDSRVGVKHNITKLILGLVVLGFVSSSFANLGRPTTSWFEGQIPGWAQNCIDAELNGILGSLPNRNKCNSVGYPGAWNSLGQFSIYNFSDGSYSFSDFIQSVHVVVTDIGQDYNIPTSLVGLCSSGTCFRAIIYINGDSYTGEHVATFVTTPGKPWEDGTGQYTVESAEDSRMWLGNRTPELYYRVHMSSDEMGLGGSLRNRFENYYIMDHYVNSNSEDMPWAVFYNQGTAFHASYTVNGNVGSHGCTRLKYQDSKIMNYLARHVGRNFTVETRYTELEDLTQDQRNNATNLMENAVRTLETNIELRERAAEGDSEAESLLFHRTVEAGGLY